VRREWRVGADDIGNLQPFCPSCWEEELAGDPVPTTIRVGPTHVIVRRGVASYVDKRGGRLYLWGDPFTDDYEWMHAGTEHPGHVRFVRSAAVVDEFALFVEEGMPPWYRLRLGRRWWGLRGGVVVSLGVISHLADQPWVAWLLSDEFEAEMPDA
jgi:hypothetical protein